ncbi:MAG: efflux RND transporter periplasmic adaptor subunit [Planctomycetota bacterium]|nr:efflux RND transporter periplasmic adaptor subunit [Planctomycetota bacterium]
MKLGRQHVRFGIPFCAVLALAGLTTSSRAGDIESFTEPYRTIDVAAVETGLIIAVHIKEGDKVETHQSLADLDQDVLRATLEIARVQRDATSALTSAEAELRLRTTRLEKLEQLRLNENSSEEEVNRAALEKEIAAARVLSAKETLETKRLEFERTRIQLEQRTLRSPINGFVTEIYKDIGEFVALTDPVVVTVVQLDPLMVTFSVPVKSAKSLKSGQTVPVKIDGHKKNAEASIELVSPVINAGSQTVRVKVLLPNSGYTFQSGSKCWLVLPGHEPQLTSKSETPDTAKRN